MSDQQNSLSPAEREALKRDFFLSLHCSLPGNVVSYDAEKQTAEIQPAVKLGSLTYPVLSDVPVFMPVPFEVHPVMSIIFRTFDQSTPRRNCQMIFQDSRSQSSGTLVVATALAA